MNAIFRQMQWKIFLMNYSVRKKKRFLSILISHQNEMSLTAIFAKCISKGRLENFYLTIPSKSNDYRFINPILKR